VGLGGTGLGALGAGAGWGAEDQGTRSRGLGAWGSQGCWTPAAPGGLPALQDHGHVQGVHEQPTRTWLREHGPLLHQRGLRGRDAEDHRVPDRCWDKHCRVWGVPGGAQSTGGQSPPPPCALHVAASPRVQEWGRVAPRPLPGDPAGSVLPRAPSWLTGAVSHARARLPHWWGVPGLPMPRGGRVLADLSPCPAEPLGEDEADGPGDGSEAAVEDDRLDGLEVPEAAEGESVPCCAMLCHAMPCCAVPCHAVPCPAVLCRAMLCHAVPCHALLCCAVPCCAMLCRAMLYHAVPCPAVLCRAMLCCAMPCPAVLCRAMLCRALLAMPCCAVLRCAVPCHTVLCPAVPCCALPCCAVLCRAVPCHAVPCCAVPCCAMPCHAVPCRAVPCPAVPCCAVPCRAVPCHALLCRATPCPAVPCHAVLSC